MTTNSRGWEEDRYYDDPAVQTAVRRPVPEAFQANNRVRSNTYAERYGRVIDATADRVYVLWDGWAHPMWMEPYCVQHAPYSSP